MFNLPPAIAAIAGVLIGIHLLRVFILPIGAGEAVIDMFGFVPAQVWSAPAEGVHGIAAWVMRLVPFLSYSLLHGDFLHLTFNTVWLVALGTPVERYLGTIRFCVFAALGAVVSAAFYGALNPTSDVPMIGASGCGATRWCNVASPVGRLVLADIVLALQHTASGMSRRHDRRMPRRRIRGRSGLWSAAVRRA